MNISELMNKQKGVRDDIDKAAEEEEFVSDMRIIQLVSFLLDDEEYGVDILSVHEILRIPEVTRLPNTPDFIKGVINLRGNVIPVVDVRKRFGFLPAPATDLTRIIVVETSEKQIGLLVDNVYQVVRLPENFIDPPSELIEGVSEEFINGIGRLKNRLIIILNINNIIFLEDE